MTTETSGQKPERPGGRGLALIGASVRADARAGVARVVLEQRFANTLEEPLTIVYRMPLPHGAAVCGYSFAVGARRIVGQVERRQDARDRFEAALLEGRHAGLLEEERSSLFTQEIANIAPGAEVVVEISLDQPLVWLDEGAWEWRFPTTAAPRWLGAPGDVVDSPRVEVDVATALEPRVQLDLRIRDELSPGRSIESPSHGLLLPGGPGSGLRVQLRDGAVQLDRDLVVRWPVATPAVGVTVDLARAPDGAPTASAAYALVTLVPPEAPARPRARTMPRDVCVLLDTSGSMAGRPLEQARRVIAALVDGLDERDRLELIQFASSAVRWQTEPVAATPEARRAAVAWLAGLEAQGGTEMRAGIEAALAPLRAESQRQVVLVTDGLIGFESEVVAGILSRLPASSRLHTVGVGSAVNRSLTGPAARAGKGVEVVIGLDEDPERGARRLLARTEAPLVVDLSVGGAAVLALAPSRIADLFAGAPALVCARVRPEGGELVVRGRAAAGIWEQRLTIPAIPPGAGNSGVVSLFAREAVLDFEMQLAGGAARGEVDREVERLGLEFQISTRLTSWVAVDLAPGVPPRSARHERIPLELPYGVSAEGLGLRPALAGAAPAPAERRPSGSEAPASFVSGYGAFEIEEKTRVTAVIPAPLVPVTESTTDCIVVIYTKEPMLLGKRFVLDDNPTRVGRGEDNHLVLDYDSVSRRHARFERRGGSWRVVDDGSTNGTYRNDERIVREATLENGDRVKIGPTIFKFLSGADVEAQYHEEIYRMTIVDGLTQAYNKRYFHEALERELLRSRRHGRELAVLMVDIDHFKRTNDTHGHLAGDFMLKELARIISSRIRRDEVFARCGGEEFGIVLPETSLEGGAALAETLRRRASEHEFVFQEQRIPLTISVGVAALGDADAAGDDLVKRADERLYAAKKAGRNRVVS